MSKYHYEDPNRPHFSYCGIDIMAILQIQSEEDEPCFRCLKAAESRGEEVL